MRRTISIPSELASDTALSVGLTAKISSGPGSALTLNTTSCYDSSSRVRRSITLQYSIRSDEQQDESPCWHQATTWKDAVNSDATFRTSERASAGMTLSNATFISSIVIPFARHSRTNGTETECRGWRASRRGDPDLQRSTDTLCRPLVATHRSQLLMTSVGNVIKSEPLTLGLRFTLQW
jgi:hypothetical protein